MIVPMKRLTLIAMQADKESILEALQAAGAVQVLSAAEGVATEAESDLQALETRVQRLRSAAALLKPLAPKGKMGPKPEATAQELGAGMDAAMELCEKVEELDRSLAAARNDMDKRQALIDSLQPWSGLDSPIENIKSTKTVRYVTGFLPPEDLEKLKQAELDAAIETYGSTEKTVAMLLACRTEDYPQVQELLKTLDFSDFSFGALTGSPKANMDALQAQIEADKAEEARLQDALKAAAEKRDEVCRALDYAVIERDRGESLGKLGATATTFVLDGWVRADEVEKVEKAVAAVTDTYFSEYRDPAEDETPPVALQNSKLVEPYQAVTNLYSLPDYKSVDATPLFMPFYLIFFGMMLSDTGYGFVLALGCYLFLKLLKPGGMMKQIAGVLFQGGISTVVMGLFFGSFFGLTWPTVFKGLPFENVFPLIDSSAEPMMMLGLCAGLGLIHMFFGVFIATWMRIKQGDMVAALVDNLSWFFLVIGLLMLAGPMIGLPKIVSTIGIVLAVVSSLAIIFVSGREAKSVGGKIAQGAFNFYGITSWLGDVLSYARIFALGLSTGVIGLVLNTLGGMLYGAFQNGLILQILGIIITGAMLVFLHGFMMAINVLGSFVHTARLQYVEFFGKFYEAGGKPFRPLRYSPKSVRMDG